MIDAIVIIWYEFMSRVLVAILGILFILIGILSPDAAYDTMKKAVERY